jgi:stage II sporulation protein P
VNREKRLRGKLIVVSLVGLLILYVEIPSFWSKLGKEFLSLAELAISRQYMPSLLLAKEEPGSPFTTNGCVEALAPIYAYAAMREHTQNTDEALSHPDIIENVSALQAGRSEGYEDDPRTDVAGNFAGQKEPQDKGDANKEDANKGDANIGDINIGDMGKGDIGKEDIGNAGAGQENVGEDVTFLPHSKQLDISLDLLSDFSYLIKEFYTVDASTMIGRNELIAEKMAEKDLSLRETTQGPQILIYHTHSQEGFADSIEGDASTTIVGAGEWLATILREQYGYRVLHHTVSYDEKTRNDAYGRALPEIQKILQDNPTIEVVIDLHRDAMPEGKRLVVDLDGRPTAKFMFFNGISRTKNTGDISYLKNENLQDNLAFSFQMQMAAYEYYPGVTRKIYLKGYRYNMHLAPKYLLVELGAQNNTTEEAWNACEVLAHLLDIVLSRQ